jgi:hypothetical protein
MLVPFYTYVPHYHTLNKGHTYRTITDTMAVIRTGRKGRLLSTLEKYYICKINRDN